MPCRGGCGGAKKAAQNGSQSMEARVMASAEPRPDRIRMEFVGRQTGPIGYTVNGHTYYGANTDENRFVDALPQDAEKLARLNVWRFAPIDAPVQVSAPQVAPPAPLPPAPPMLETRTVPVFQSSTLTIVDGDGNPIKKTIPVQTQTAVAQPVNIVTSAPTVEQPAEAPKKRARKPKAAQGA